MCNILFQGLDNEEKNNFLKYFTKQEIKKNEIIKREGEEVQKAFFIIEGEVEIRKKFSDKDMHVTTLTANDNICFSITCMFDGGKSLTTVVALKPMIIMEISKEELLNFCMKNPLTGIKILNNIINKLCNIIRKKDEKENKMYQTLEDML